MSTEMANPWRLFVTPLSPKLPHRQIKQYFEQFGEVVEVTTRPDYTGFVYCKDKTEAEKIAKSSHKSKFNGRTLTVRVAEVQGNCPGKLECEKLGVCWNFNYTRNCTKGALCLFKHVCKHCVINRDVEEAHAADDSECPAQTEGYTPNEILRQLAEIERSGAPTENVREIVEPQQDFFETVGPASDESSDESVTDQSSSPVPEVMPAPLDNLQGPSASVPRRDSTEGQWSLFDRSNSSFDREDSDHGPLDRQCSSLDRRDRDRRSRTSSESGRGRDTAHYSSSERDRSRISSDRERRRQSPPDVHHSTRITSAGDRVASGRNQGSRDKEEERGEISMSGDMSSSFEQVFELFSGLEEMAVSLCDFAKNNFFPDVDWNHESMRGQKIDELLFGSAVACLTSQLHNVVHQFQHGLNTQMIQTNSLKDIHKKLTDVERRVKVYLSLMTSGRLNEQVTLDGLNKSVADLQDVLKQKFPDLRVEFPTYILDFLKTARISIRYSFWVFTWSQLVMDPMENSMEVGELLTECIDLIKDIDDNLLCLEGIVPEDETTTSRIPANRHNAITANLVRCMNCIFKIFQMSADFSKKIKVLVTSTDEYVPAQEVLQAIRLAIIPFVEDGDISTVPQALLKVKTTIENVFEEIQPGCSKQQIVTEPALQSLGANMGKNNFTYEPSKFFANSSHNNNPSTSFNYPTPQVKPSMVVAPPTICGDPSFSNTGTGAQPSCSYRTPSTAAQLPFISDQMSLSSRHREESPTSLVPQCTKQLFETRCSQPPSLSATHDASSDISGTWPLSTLAPAVQPNRWIKYLPTGAGQGENLYGSSDSIIVSNLPATETCQRLGKRFSHLGKVLHVEMKPWGAGIIRFSNKKEAERAVCEMNGWMVNGGPLSVKLYFVSPTLN